MALFPLTLPPGIYRNGTELQSAGRWFDCNLVRWYEGTIRPIGGWRKKTRVGSLTNPFTTVLSSNTITVAHTAHGLRVGDVVMFGSGVAVGGLTMTGVNWVVTSVAANSYTFTHTSIATSSAGPLGGTVAYTYAQAVSGKARAIIAWKDNSITTWAGIGTHTNLYAMSRSGSLYDITPAGFTSGIPNATGGAGYGAGIYGAATYGTARADATAIQDATVWTLDTWGQDLVGCTVDDGKIYEWTLNPVTVAAVVANAPTSVRAVVVTAERFMFALGAAGVPRRVQWSDQANDTLWAAAATNQAGSFDLQTLGKLMQGRNIRGGTLLWTDLDVHLARYIGGTFIYSFTRLSEGCGAISQNCAATLDSRAVWMGRNGFWIFNGYVTPLHCEVNDFVFSNLNVAQISKVSCLVNSTFGEVTWYYPSSPSGENDSFVTWNYRENTWAIGSLVRLSGIDRGAMMYPLEMGNDGFVYEHEIGFNYDGVWPFVESGPIQLANGDSVMYAVQLIPDDKTIGDVTATFKTKIYPDGAETSFGPYSLSSSTDVRFCGRQTKVRYTGTRLADWRVGAPRLDLRPGGAR